MSRSNNQKYQQRRGKQKNRHQSENQGNLQIMQEIEPMTDAQMDAFEAWKEGYNLVLHGVPGSGKTFLALYFSLMDTIDKYSGFSTIYIIRSVVPSRSMGFLPGKQHEKEAVYEVPYKEICTKLFGRSDAYQILKQKKIIQFTSTSFLRGINLDDCIILVDEMQNMNDQELHTIMSRVGQNSKIFFCGDIKQDDLTSVRYNETSGIKDFLKVIEAMPEEHFDKIEFLADDIVRSGIVKDYILTRDKVLGT